MAPTEPIPLGPNLVPRFYRGGGRLAAFRAEAEQAVPADACEDWVGSVTRAWSPPDAPPIDAGLARLPDGRLLSEAVGETGVLELLDAGERLPVHCHPSRPFASSVLGSPFGKAEAWIVLETFQVAGAERPNVRLGWREGFTRSDLLELIEGQEVETMLAAMPVRELRPGDVWFVPPGVPHAIGAGVFMVEVQEPTDFSIVAEVAGFPVDPDDAHLHRGWETMVAAFDREPMSDDRLEALRQEPTGVAHADGLRETRLLGADASRFFRAARLELDGEAPWPYPGELSVGVVVGGSGVLRGRRTTLPVRRGVTFAVPPDADGVGLHGRGLELLACWRGTEPPLR